MNVGFTKKDLYNFIDMDHKSKMRHGDAEGALVYLYAKKEMKLSFLFYDYTADNETSLENLYSGWILKVN
jgi:methionine salvage enolase-phosphatase E1